MKQRGHTPLGWDWRPLDSNWCTVHPNTEPAKRSTDVQTNCNPSEPSPIRAVHSPRVSLDKAYTDSWQENCEPYTIDPVWGGSPLPVSPCVVGRKFSVLPKLT